MSPRFRLLASTTLFVAAGVLAWVSFSRRANDRPTSQIPKGVRPVVLVTFDTTRSDRLEPYGATDVATPALARLADRGIVFDRASAVAPITLVAHTSILTGLYPLQHGVRNNGIQYVSAEITTLAEILQDRGFHTGAFVSASVLEKRYGLDQGFDVYDDDLSAGRDRHPRSVPDRPAEAAVDSAFSWLDSVPAGDPFFLWVHFYDPHAAYSPPPPFRDDYRDRLYDGEIAYTDSQLERLLKHPRLKASGAAEPIVTMMADHGESLGEHGEQTHAILAFDSTLHVPWIMAIPGGPRGKRVAESVSQVDFLPTILSLLGIPAPSVEGRDLLGVIEGSATAPQHPYYAETYLPFYTYGWAKLHVLRSGPWKLIQAPTPELYHLGRDPRELTNVYESQPGVAHDLSRDLQELLERTGGAEKETSLEVDAESLEKLRSLGYLAAGSGPPRREVRPNPMEAIDLHVGLERARVLAQDRLFEQATRLLRTVLERDPENLAALIDLASVLEAQGETDRAIETIERALSLDPGYTRLYVSLASLEANRNNFDKALELVEVAQDREPGNPDIAMHRASLLVRLGRSKEATATLDSALAAHPDHPRLNTSYARLVEIPRQELAQAEARLRRAVERDPFLTSGWQALGQLLARQGRHAEASECFRRGLSRQSDDPELHASLGQLLARQGDRPQAEQHLREAIRLSPRFRPDLHVALGAVLAEGNHFLEARREYDRVLAVAPDHPGARNNTAIALYRSGQLEEAKRILEQLVEDFPDHADAHNNLAAIFIETGNWRAVEASSRRTLELDPTLVEAWNNLAVALEELGRRSEAVGAYERALALEPTYWQAEFNLGLLQLRSDRPAEAAQHFAAVLERVPAFAEAHFQLGELFAGPLRDPAKARVHYNAFLKYAPGDRRSNNVRAALAQLPSSS